MIEKSLRIYIFGFTIGVIICFILVLTYPSLYYAFLALLLKKEDVQEEVAEALGGNLAISIGLNNILASLLCAYGGYLATMTFLRFKTSTSQTMVRILRYLDEKIASLPRDRVKYYLALYVFPTFILFVNGFVLGAFFILYNENLESYFSNLMPHGFFEIPAILLSGSIGLSIAEDSVFSEGDLREKLNNKAQKQLLNYALVVELLVISALLEVLPV